MNRLATWLLGPELYWLVAYALSRMVAARSARTDPASIQLLERSSWVVPLVLVPLSFLIFYWLTPIATPRWWLTARLALATFIGLNACLIVLIDAIDYGDSRNSGVLGFWAIGVGIGVLLWIVGYIVVLISGVRGRAA